MSMRWWWGRRRNVYWIGMKVGEGLHMYVKKKMMMIGPEIFCFPQLSHNVVCLYTNEGKRKIFICLKWSCMCFRVQDDDCILFSRWRLLLQNDNVVAIEAVEMCVLLKTIWSFFDSTYETSSCQCPSHHVILTLYPYLSLSSLLEYVCMCVDICGEKKCI